MNWGYESGIANQTVAKQTGNDSVPDSANLMNNTPNEMGMMQERELANVGSSTTEKDKDHAEALASQTVATLIAQGASDEQIRQAVANLPISPEHMALAQRTATEQIEADKFNVFSNRNEEQGQDQGLAFVSNMVSGLAGLVAGTKLEQGITGGDEVSLAALGNLAPLQTPNLAQERERGFGLA